MDIIQTSKRLQTMQDNVAGLETKKQALEQDLAYKKSNRFVEEEARNRLNMIKKGEKVLVLPAIALSDKTKPQQANTKPSEVLGSNSDTSEDDNQTNIWQWIELFL